MDTTMSQSNRDNASNVNNIHSKEELPTPSDYDHDVKSSPNDLRNQDDDNWVLQIKMVGGESNQSDFQITLHPNDDIIQLYHEITNVTDIPYYQQRLIYRGRLLPHVHHTPTAATAPSTKVNATAMEDVSLLPQHSTDGDISFLQNATNKVASTTSPTRVSQHLLLNQKVRDIVGLMNGHAIHLVVRHNDSRSTDDEDEDENQNEEGLTTTITSDPASTTSSSSSSPTGSTSLLAALLGMGAGSSNSNERTTGATRSSQARRHHTYRLTEEDWIRPDPGSLETVRQGLMTFHTLHQVNHSITNTAVNRNDNDSPSVTVQAPTPPNRSGRHFYLGQWIDCRDTVNQWLEATVVRILYPRDIMHSCHTETTSNVSTSSDDNNNNVSCPFQPTTDPPIAVTDFDGRRRLLLEPCSESESEECIDGEHFRRRTNNENVQILHIHYNGWPVRWDEWIRSDSERIRVFRTRTRHHPSSVDQQPQRHYMSPNIDSVMPDAPYTYITNSDQTDRSALLSELHRALHTLEHRVATVAASPITTSSNNVRTSRMNHLPWTTGESSTAAATTPLDTNHGDTATPEPMHQDLHSQPVLSRQQQRQELEALAPLLDRLGRVLIDSAPHLLALADTIGHEGDEEDDDADDNNESHVEYDTDETEPRDTPPATNTLGGLLSLLNRDRRGVGRGSVASGSNVALPSVVSDVEISTVASSSTTTTDVVVQPTEPNSTTNLVASNIVDPDDEDDMAGENEATTEYIDPDYRDYAAGLVNISRGDARSTSGSGGSSSSRRGSSSDDGTTSLLGAYLAAMSLGGIASISTGDREDGDGGGVAEGLGRLFRDRGAGSGGIDIHIHAVVTAPGLDGAIGFAALTGGGGAGGGGTFPVATPVRGQDTTTNTAHGGLGNLFGGSASQRRSGSRRFRSATTATATDNASIDDQPVVGETNTIEDDLDLFADLYSETPEPINPNNPTYLVPTVTAAAEADEDSVEFREGFISSSSPLRHHRPLSLRRIHAIHASNSSENSGEQYQHSTSRSYRNEQRNTNSNEQRSSGNGNSNLLRRIFRRPEGGH